MRNTIKQILLVSLFCLLASGQVMAQEDTTPEADSQAPAYRFPDEERLEEFRNSEDFQYLEQAAPGKSLWDRFWAFVKRVLSFLFGGQSSSLLGNVIRFLIYALALGAVGFAVYRLILIRTGRITAKTSGESLNPEVAEEDIHALDFEKLLTEAVAGGNWRLAIRLRYLQTLKLLSDRELIDWEPYKTNHEYGHEIGTGDLRERFERISRYFDYAWYGEFQVNEKHYQRVGEIFSEMKGSI